MTGDIFGAQTHRLIQGGAVMGRKFGALGNALTESEEKQRRGESGLSPFSFRQVWFGFSAKADNAAKGLGIGTQSQNILKEASFALKLISPFKS